MHPKEKYYGQQQRIDVSYCYHLIVTQKELTRTGSARRTNPEAEIIYYSGIAGLRGTGSIKSIKIIFSGRAIFHFDSG